MYGELASVRGIVDLSPQDALDRAQTFLTHHGYKTVRRTDTSLTAERRPTDQAEERQDALDLTVEAVPQPGGGVRIKVWGNDREAVQEQQAAWVEWSEGLPKKPEAPTTEESGDQTRTIETPEVPPPPTLDSPDLSAPPQPSPAYPVPPRRGSRRWPWVALGLGGCVVLVALLSILVVAGLAAFGSSGIDVGVPFGGGSGKTFTNENYADLVADPDDNRGAAVDVTGRVFQPPEVRGSEAAFQMWADPKNSDWNTLVRTEADSAKVKTNDYVRVTGTVRGSVEGENPFGANVSAVEVDADGVEEVDAAEALDPAQETIEVGQTQEDKGFSVTVDKVEVAEETTRVYVTARNGTKSNANFFTRNARLVQGSRQVDPEVPFQYDLPEPQSELNPGVETEGVVTFGPIDPSKSFRIRFEWSSRNSRVKAQPLVFEISP